jgi:hypothetical protein
MLESLSSKPSLPRVSIAEFEESSRVVIVVFNRMLSAASKVYA